MASASKCAIVAVALFALLLTHGFDVVDARRNQGSNQRKTSSSSSNSGHVTQSYSTHSNNGGNSHADAAKLSYPNYNSQPNRPPNGQPPAAGWNVPQGPPPAYSASNPAGGAHSNIHEHPPAYQAPNYGSNVHQPITPNNYGQQHAGAPPSYPAAGNYPAGGGYPGGGYMNGASGGYPAPGGYGGYHQGAAAPPGATYIQPGSALPPGAILYSQPPQQSSSGLGFGTGLLAGGLGGALLGHALTPSGGSSSQPAAAAPAAAAGQDRIIIINNGVPVNASDGTTVINAAGTAAAPMNATAVSADAQPAQLAPMAPMAPMANGTDAAQQSAPPPSPGGIICVPTKVNETDPADSSKMIEVEKIACYPAPPPPAAAPGAEPVPLAPMATSQSPPAMLPPDQAAVRSNTSGGAQLRVSGFTLFIGLFGALLLRWVKAAN